MKFSRQKRETGSSRGAWVPARGHLSDEIDARPRRIDVLENLDERVIVCVFRVFAPRA